MQDITAGFTRYLAEKIPGARDVEVKDVRRIHGGASRETYRLTAEWTGPEIGGGGAGASSSGGAGAGGAGEAGSKDAGAPAAEERRSLGMIVRRDPTSSLIETQRTTEWDAYAAFHGTEVPVPRPLFLEDEKNEWLGRPFFVMEEVAGCESGFAAFKLKPYSELIDEIGTAKWRILGKIAATDPAAVGLDRKMEAPERGECWRRELDTWEKVIDADELEPQPIIRAAIRRLRKKPPPPPARVGVVHGDYRTGNFLFDREGRVRAILDWEMCHLGDPLEDLAWALTPLWGWPDANRPGKLIERDRALAVWSEANGIEIDAEALRWWEIFACVKGLAIWISSSREYHDAKNQDPIMIVSGWFCTDVHTRVLLDLIDPTKEGAR